MNVFTVTSKRFCGNGEGFWSDGVNVFTVTGEHFWGNGERFWSDG